VARVAVAASGVRPSVRLAALHHLLGAFEALAGTPARLLGLPAASSRAASRARVQISNRDPARR